MLSGIALVVEDIQKGQKLAFRYPGPRSVEFDQEFYRLRRPGSKDIVGHHHQNGSAGGHHQVDGVESHAGNGGGYQDKKNRSYSSSVGSAASEMSLSLAESSIARGHVAYQRQNKGEESNHKPSSMRKRAAMMKDFWRFDPELFAKLFRPTQSQCGHMFELVIDNLRFLCFPVQIKKPETANVNSSYGIDLQQQQHHQHQQQAQQQSQNQQQQQQQQQVDGSAHQLSMFSLILILDAECEQILEQSRYKLGIKPGKGSYGLPYVGSKESLDMYRKAAMKLAAGMLCEENRCGYVSEQVQFMLDATKSMFTAESSGTGAGRLVPNDSEDQKSKLNSKQTSNVYVDGDLAHKSIEARLKHSDLARELKMVFHGLRDEGYVQLKLNRRIGLSMTLQNPLLHPKHPMRPYQTILLYGEKGGEKNLNLRMMGDCSPQIYRFAEYILKTPRSLQKSFEDISGDLNVPIQEIFRMAAHLVYWRKGIIMDVVQVRNIYRVAPSANLDPLSPLTHQFQVIFNNGKQRPKKASSGLVTLPKVLELFSLASHQTEGPATVGELIDRARKSLDVDVDTFLDILEWLLRHEFLIQMHRYFYFIPPTQSKFGPKKVRAGDTRPVGKFGMSAADVAAAAAMAADQAVVAEVQAAQAQAVQTAQVTNSIQAIHAEQATVATTSGANQGTQVSQQAQAALQAHQTQQAQSSQPQMDLFLLNEGTPGGGNQAMVMDGAGQGTHGQHHHQQQQSHHHHHWKKPSTISAAQVRNENAFLDAIATDNDMYRLFRRLTPYFHGKHSQEEIVWRENITNEVFEKVLTNYSEVVFPYLHL